MSKSKTAIAIAQAVYLECPHCHEPIEDPRNGSYMITSNSFVYDETKCPSCAGTFVLPKTARLFS